MSEQMNNEVNLTPEASATDLDALFGSSIPAQIDLGDEPMQMMQPVSPVPQPQTTAVPPVAPVQAQVEPALQPTETVVTPMVSVPQPVPEQPAMVEATPVAPVPAVNQPSVQSATQEIPPAASTSASAPQQQEPIVDLFSVAVAESDEANAAVMLAELANKPAVFEYGSIHDDIADPSMTFEQLRNKMSADMPELEVRSHVSWTVNYNGCTERVTTPDKTTIFDVKSKIEKSKKFMDALKKSKHGDKAPICTVKPTVTAQKKGVLPFPNYKGMYESTAVAELSDKPIAYVPAQNGHVYEMRRNEIGTFIVPAKRIAELEDIGAGFSMSLPRIPSQLLDQIITFFRAVCVKYNEDIEALVNVLWDRDEECYTLAIPPQRISHALVETDLTNQPDPERYLHVMDVHSHNQMAARFSKIDDCDEQATRLYLVIGRLNLYYPELRCRFACGGQHIEIPTEQVFERQEPPCTSDWLDMAQPENKGAA